MPRSPHSTARLRLRASTPAFEIADGTTYAEPTGAYVAEMLSTVPGRFSLSHRRPQVMVQLSVPISTMLMTDSNARAERSSVREIKFPAALLTRISSGPSFQIELTNCSTASRLRTSQGTPRIGPLADSSAAVVLR